MEIEKPKQVKPATAKKEISLFDLNMEEFPLSFNSQEKFPPSITNIANPTKEGFFSFSEAFPLPVMIARLQDSEIIYVNKPFGSCFGVNPEVMVTHSCVVFYHCSADWQHLQQRIQQQNVVSNYKIKLKTLQGVPFWGIVSAQVLTLK